jgi:hypothetical protein
MNADTMVPVIAGRDTTINTISAEATAIQAGGQTGVHLRPLGRGERAAVVEVFSGLSARAPGRCGSWRRCRGWTSGC